MGARRCHDVVVLVRLGDEVTIVGVQPHVPTPRSHARRQGRGLGVGVTRNIRRSAGVSERDAGPHPGCRLRHQHLVVVRTGVRVAQIGDRQGHLDGILLANRPRRCVDGDRGRLEVRVGHRDRNGVPVERIVGLVTFVHVVGRVDDDPPVPGACTHAARQSDRERAGAVGATGDGAGVVGRAEQRVAAGDRAVAGDVRLPVEPARGVVAVVVDAPGEAHLLTGVGAVGTGDRLRHQIRLLLHIDAAARLDDVVRLVQFAHATPAVDDHA